MGIIRNILIKRLGGFTPKEMERKDQYYRGIIDSMTDSASIAIANEYMMRLLADLDRFARVDLFGSSTWGSRMYHVIHNNLYRLMIRYVHSKSTCAYKLDTTLDSEDQFINILREDNDLDSIFILENTNWEV